MFLFFHFYIPFPVFRRLLLVSEVVDGVADDKHVKVTETTFVLLVIPTQEFVSVKLIARFKRIRLLRFVSIPCLKVLSHTLSLGLAVLNDLYLVLIITITLSLLLNFNSQVKSLHFKEQQ